MTYKQFFFFYSFTFFIYKTCAQSNYYSTDTQRYNYNVYTSYVFLSASISNVINCQIYLKPIILKDSIILNVILFVTDGVKQAN